MPSIKDLFKPRPLGDQATVFELQRQVADLHLALNDAEVAANHLFLEAATGGEAAKAKADQAALELTHLRDELARARGALQEAESRLEENELIAAEAAETKAWTETEKLLRVRHDVAVRIETALINVAGDWAELVNLTKEIRAAAPVRVRENPSDFERALRLFLVRNGFAWAVSYPWDKTKIKPFSAVIKDANTVLTSKRPEQVKAA